jgi:hypothetical protein
MRPVLKGETLLRFPSLEPVEVVSGAFRYLSPNLSFNVHISTLKS